MLSEIDWDTLGYKSGRARVERDGAYFDPISETLMFGPNGELQFIAGGVVNGDDPRDARTGQAVWRQWGAEIAPRIIPALQPERAQDEQFHADCQRFAAAFLQGYIAAPR
jgi:hypothetical protein